MSSFWTLEFSKVQTSFMFNKLHYLFLLSSLVLIIFFSMYMSRQRLNNQKFFVGFCIFLLLGLEAVRLYWRYRFLRYNGIEINFFSITELNFYTLAMWISIPLLIISLIVKKQDNTVFGLSFVFGIATIIAASNLIYPQGLNTNFQLYHCYNLIYILSRTIIITLGIFFVAANWTSVIYFSDMWRYVISLLFFGVVSALIGYFFNNGTNLLYFNNCPIFEEVGIHAPFPFQYLLLGVFMFVLQYIVILPFRKIKNRKKQNLNW